MFVIRTDTLFLAHEQNTTTNPLSAWQFVDQTKAKNVLRTIKKTISYMPWRIEQIQSDGHIPEPIAIPAPPLDNLDAKIKELEDGASHLSKRRLYLQALLANVDREISDIEHAAEFYQLNAARGYKLYKLLRDARIRRRSYKDELQKISYLQGATFKTLESGIVSQQVRAMDHRVYAPRVLQELFGD